MLERRIAVPPRGPRALWHRRLDLPLVRRFQAVHATRPSEEAATAPFLRAGASTTTIPWSVEDGPPVRTSRSAPDATRPFLLFVGRLHPIKGVERLLAAMAAMPPSASSLRLLLCGSGARAYVASISSRAAALGLRDRVEFLGWVDDAALEALRREARALVLPSHYENFGMAAAEALRDACPVVAARETPWERLDATGAGRTVDFDDPAAAGRVLADVAFRDGREAMRGAARSLYEAEFAPERVIPRFVAFYETVARDARDAGARREARPA